MACTDQAQDCRTIRALLARLAPQTMEQLAAEVLRLSEQLDTLTAENADLRREIAATEDTTEYWRRSFMDLEEQLYDHGGALGMTVTGAFVAIPSSPESAAEHIPATQEQTMRFQKLDADGVRVPDGAIDHVAVLDTFPHPDGMYRVWPVAALGELAWNDADAAAKGCTLMGATDWRLPTRHELLSLVDDSRCSPAIDTDAFPGTESDLYWTSSAWANSPKGCAWFVLFDHGGAGYYHRGDKCFVRAVRSVSPGQCSALGLVKG